MNKEISKKATLEDFVAKKVKKEKDKDKTKDIYVTSMDRAITLKKPSEERIYSYANEIGDKPDLASTIEANRKLIYDCCQELKEPQVIEALELKDPYDIPRILFDIADIKEIMNQFNELLGNTNIEEEIKN
ncbi:hypothetical protein CLPUN_09770 [Clostridium puniceum]|uniref:Phage XkdN-like protein n=1 Tax=Clostridium puniceum TaxID=29367 RepID=A0A1S8TVG6_9CLOT|nr:hypothetical protein [Clostridium puniceum]OOM81793.1 hypothetical protein CLPUN_09770 [Clostridium puniceum]